MAAWIQVAGLMALVGLGIYLGRYFSRLQSSWWLIGFLFPLFYLILVGATRYYHLLTFVPPFSWATWGRLEFILSALMIPMLLISPLSRLQRKPLRLLVVLFMAIATVYYSFLPILLPHFLRHDMLQLKAKPLKNGFCLQSTSYNCGPAAAVTALWHLGIEASEGEIAILASTNPMSGTPDDVLTSALQKRYGSEGVWCERKPLKTIDELQEAGLVLVTIKYSFQVDHYVAVINVTDNEVILADPMIGEIVLDHESFLEKWRRCGIVLGREPKL